MVWYTGHVTSTAGCCCTEPLGGKKHFCFQIIPPNLICPSSLVEQKWGNPVKVTFPQEERLHLAAPDIILLLQKSSDTKTTTLVQKSTQKKIIQQRET